MLKFVLGALCGCLVAFGYVRYAIDLPEVLLLPERLRGNLISAATEGDLYDLSLDEMARRRALEVYFHNRPADAAELDREAGHPFLNALHKSRADHEARLLTGELAAFDTVFSKPALRAALERKHGTNDTAKLKRALLAEALDRQTFLKSWLSLGREVEMPEALRQALAEVLPSR